MMKNYKDKLQVAEQILNEAKFSAEYAEDLDVKLYYDLQTQIEELGLNKSDEELFLNRLDSILDKFL